MNQSIPVTGYKNPHTGKWHKSKSCAGRLIGEIYRTTLSEAKDEGYEMCGSCAQYFDDGDT